MVVTAVGRGHLGDVDDAALADAEEAVLLQQRLQGGQGILAPKDPIFIIEKGLAIDALDVKNGVEWDANGHILCHARQRHRTLPQSVQQIAHAGVYRGTVDDDLDLRHGLILIDPYFHEQPFSHRVPCLPTVSFI